MEANSRDLTLSDLLQGRAAGHPDRCCLTWGEAGRATYGELAAAVRVQAEALRDAGLVRRRVALMARNRPEGIVLWLACMDAGCSLVFLNPELTPGEVATILDDLDVEVLLAEAEIAATVPGATPLPERRGLEVNLPIGETGAVAEEAPKAGAIVLTSGSTDRPKYVAVPHAAYVLKGALNAMYLGWGPAEVAYGVMPFFHVGAQCETLAPAFAAGARVDIIERFSAGRLGEELEGLGTTHLHATGSLLAMGLAAGIGEKDLKALERIVASLRPDLVERLAEIAPGAELISLYGLTECPLGTLVRPGDEYRPGWVGSPYAGPGSIRVVGESGQTRPEGEEGEVQLRNEACALGYLGPSPSHAFTADGWLRTGDLGWLADGGLYLTGRIKEMIRRSGENISPAQVEAAALAHPGVVEAAAIPHPDPVRDEEVRLAVEIAADREAPGPGELRSHMAEALARHKLPRYIDVLAELPKTPSGKVDKPRLAELHPKPLWDAESYAGGSLQARRA